MKTTKGSSKIVLILIAVLVIALGGYFLTGDDDSAMENTGDQLVADFDADGKDDLAYFASQRTSTTTLYYLAVSLDTEGEKRAVEPRLIGNQIIPINIEFREGHIIANYVDREPGEPMSAEARFAFSKTFAIRDGKLVRAISL